MRFLIGWIICAALVTLCYADIYMHNPRGSNNRLNEGRATRATNNRVFDSQNNARGGYNVGDRTDKKAGNNEKNQYQMEYFMSGVTSNDVTELMVEWTNQHGCGGDEDDNPTKLNCNIIIQYMDEKKESDEKKGSSEKSRMRDGTSTNRQDYTNIPGERNRKGVRTFTEAQSRYNGRKNGNVKPDRAYNEPHEWYDKCRARYRNKGLFTADQNLKQDRATHTRQNPNGNRNGYECPEERDYYPYWHPTPWKDVVIFTKDTSRCGYYRKESFNEKPKGECIEKWQNSNDDRHYSSANTRELCEKTATGEWVEYWNYLEIYEAAKSEPACNSASVPGYTLKWATPYRISGVDLKSKACLVLLKTVECEEAPFSRPNHLGNGADLEPLRYTWKLPNYPSGNKMKFVLRIRYNITTDDYDPHNTFSEANGGQSPVKGNPLVDIGATNPLQLAINTAQFGRTFQDRSHISHFVKRPKGVNGKIYNLNVRGKRGNIVQTFPAVEYDFVPNLLKVKSDDLIHIQWTGSNSHNNGNPGGDGQTGDAGQGTGGTDRHNMVGLNSRDDNFPSAMESENNMCHHMDVVWEKSKGASHWYDVCVKLGSAGYYDCKTGCTNSLDKKTQMNNLLNNAPASFSGMIVKMKTSGRRIYTCTRNNAFTNRSQKGEIVVS